MIREKKITAVEPMLLRIRDAAAMLSVSERTVWQLLRAAELRAIRLPRMRAVRIARHDVKTSSSAGRIEPQRPLKRKLQSSSESLQTLHS